MIKIIYKGEDLKGIEKEVEKAYKIASSIFGIKIPAIVVRVHENRNSYDKKLNKLSPNWEVATAYRSREIDILSPKSFQKESPHSKKEFSQVLVHEFVHLMISKTANGKTVPLWLNEGLAKCIARQQNGSKEPLFIEDGFCEKLGTQRGWDEHVNYSAYSIAALFVKFLIKEYSFLKIKKLISSLDRIYNYSNFKKTFNAVYKIDIEILEKKFISELNKKKIKQ